MTTNALAQLYPIRTVRTRSGVLGFALHAYNDHSGAWHPIGRVCTGPRAWQEIHLDKMQLLHEMEQERVEAEEQRS